MTCFTVNSSKKGPLNLPRNPNPWDLLSALRHHHFQDPSPSLGSFFHEAPLLHSTSPPLPLIFFSFPKKSHSTGNLSSACQERCSFTSGHCLAPTPIWEPSFTVSTFPAWSIYSTKHHLMANPTVH